uniref:Uncharacterized protein n=1 Tax=Setaria italica TaxID=4555 RepID=K3YB27_SETIT
MSSLSTSLLQGAAASRAWMHVDLLWHLSTSSTARGFFRRCLCSILWLRSLVLLVGSPCCSTRLQVNKAAVSPFGPCMLLPSSFTVPRLKTQLLPNLKPLAAVV